jgi:glycosyltransferase involved in cell wall biosynthesis
MHLNIKDAAIAYISSNDLIFKRSGITNYMCRALLKYLSNVTLINPPKIDINKVKQSMGNTIKSSDGKKYDCSHSLSFSEKCSDFLSKKIKEKKYDFIISPSTSAEIALLETNIPVIYLSDSTFALMTCLYPDFSNLADISINEGNTIESLAIRKASLLIYPSNWAADSAINVYGAEKSKVIVVQPGNLEYIPPLELIYEKKKSKDCIRILFISSDWDSDGISIAYDTVVELNKMGLKAKLILYGCTPKCDYSNELVKIIGFIDKKDNAEMLYRTYDSCHFALIPEKNETYNEFHTEISAFGIPAIISDTGKLTKCESLLFETHNPKGQDYAKLIKRLYKDENLYYSLVKSARKSFDDSIDWNNWAQNVIELLNIKL